MPGWGGVLGEARAASDFSPLLSGYCIYLEPSSQLKPLVQALGSVLARNQQESTRCILRKGGRPRGLKAEIPVVREEWLLEATVNYKLPEISEWCI